MKLPKPLSHAVVCTVFALMGCVDMSAQACVQTDLGPFVLCVPKHWEVRKGGVDSAAGRLTGKDLSISYDFGLYSDPLRVPVGATDVQESVILVGGLPARRVTYSVERSGAVPMHYVGVHVPDVRQSSMGRLKLTLLAHTQDRQNFADVDALLPTIEFKPSVSR